MDASEALTIDHADPWDGTVSCVPSPIAPGPADMMQANLLRLFCETDPERRGEALAALWHDDPLVCEQGRTRAGRTAVLALAAAFSARMEGLTCGPAAPVLACDDFYFLKWEAREGGRLRASGNHVALLREGRIDTFYLLDD